MTQPVPRPVCPSCGGWDNNPYTDDHGQNMRACGRCMIQWVDESATSAPALPDVEVVSEKVHEKWMDTKRAKGVTTRKSESGEELMVPYSQLSEAAKDLDRGSVIAVLEALTALRSLSPEQAVPLTPSKRPIHKTVRVQVWADVDEPLSDIVRYLNTIPDVTTHASCQGTIGEGGPEPYRAEVMCSWTPEALARLRSEFDVTIPGESDGTWGYIHPRNSEAGNNTSADRTANTKAITVPQSSASSTQPPAEIEVEWPSAQEIASRSATYRAFDRHEYAKHIANEAIAACRAAVAKAVRKKSGK